jgi:hypothetical protein
MRRASRPRRRPTNGCIHREVNGGEGGIRTPDSLATMPDFESGAFNRALPPLRRKTVPFLAHCGARRPALTLRDGLRFRSAALPGLAVLEPRFRQSSQCKFTLSQCTGSRLAWQSRVPFITADSVLPAAGPHSEVLSYHLAEFSREIRAESLSLAPHWRA